MISLAEDLKANLVSYLSDQIIRFSVVENLNSESVGLPRCVVEVVDDGEEILHVASRYKVTVTLMLEAAGEDSKVLLKSGSADLDAALFPDYVRQACTDGDVVIDGVLSDVTTSDIDGEVWTRSRSVTIYAHATIVASL
ncbi:hypothetical protein [Propionivibrio sp.]|uniref:hypothetical protein n=1 Tax=Propionivibrio sp. TaxID=2212460 RepID=UPI003BF0B3E6